MPIVKIEERDNNKFPCLECKAMCSGYWYVSRHGFKRPLPFCEQCAEKGTNDRCNKGKTK